MAEIIAATVGDNCIDRYLTLGKSMVGGNAVNVAVHLAKVGIGTAYYGAIGKDADGARIRAALLENGVDLAGLRVRESAITGYSDIAFGPGGERIIGPEVLGACGDYRPTDEDMAKLFRMRHVHIGWIDDGGAVKDALVAAGVNVSQDLSVTSPSGGRTPNGLAIAFASAGASLDEGSAVARQLLAGGARSAVVTCGAAGSVAANHETLVTIDAQRIDVVDTLGAGDTFFAGFIAARLGGGDLMAGLRAGREGATATCGHLGGFPQVPRMLT